MPSPAILNPGVCEILDTAAGQFALDREEILGPSSVPPAPQARAMAMAELRDRYGWSHRRIGELFRKDQSTVHHALKVLRKGER